MNNLICSAIRSKRLIQFYYNGGDRISEPYCYGISRNGKELMRVFQISGYSKSGKSYEWKLFSVNNITNITILDNGFSALRPEYNPNDSEMKTIYCCV